MMLQKKKVFFKGFYISLPGGRYDFKVTADPKYASLHKVKNNKNIFLGYNCKVILFLASW